MQSDRGNFDEFTKTLYKLYEEGAVSKLSAPTEGESLYDTYLRVGGGNFTRIHDNIQIGKELQKQYGLTPHINEISQSLHFLELENGKVIPNLENYQKIASVSQSVIDQIRPNLEKIADDSISKRSSPNPVTPEEREKFIRELGTAYLHTVTKALGQAIGQNFTDAYQFRERKFKEQNAFIDNNPSLSENEKDELHVKAMAQYQAAVDQNANSQRSDKAFVAMPILVKFARVYRVGPEQAAAEKILASPPSPREEGTKKEETKKEETKKEDTMQKVLTRVSSSFDIAKRLSGLPTRDIRQVATARRPNPRHQSWRLADPAPSVGRGSKPVSIARWQEGSKSSAPAQENPDTKAKKIGEHKEGEKEAPTPSPTFRK